MSHLPPSHSPIDSHADKPSFFLRLTADEVVSVLTVLGEIFGLSDAIIGLTIFAVGNSTADLVANLSIASFAPIMAFSGWWSSSFFDAPFEVE